MCCGGSSAWLLSPPLGVHRAWVHRYNDAILTQPGTEASSYAPAAAMPRAVQNSFPPGAWSLRRPDALDIGKILAELRRKHDQPAESIVVPESLSMRGTSKFPCARSHLKSTSSPGPPSEPREYRSCLTYGRSPGDCKLSCWISAPAALPQWTRHRSISRSFPCPPR